VIENTQRDLNIALINELAIIFNKMGIDTEAMLKKRIQVMGARVLVIGLTFKENCPDLRNTRVVDVVAELQDYGVTVDVHDPWVDADEAEREYKIRPVSNPEAGSYDGIILAVAHDQFRTMTAKSIRQLGATTHVLYDIKAVCKPEESDLRL